MKYNTCGHILLCQSTVKFHMPYLYIRVKLFNICKDIFFFFQFAKGNSVIFFNYISWTLHKECTKIKSNYTLCRQIQREGFICKKKNPFQSTRGHWWHSVTYLVGQQLTQSKLTHRDGHEINILPTEFSCALWKNLLLKNSILQLLSALRSERKARKIWILWFSGETGRRCLTLFSVTRTNPTCLVQWTALCSCLGSQKFSPFFGHSTTRFAFIPFGRKHIQ
jgi:hypothetical protein